MRILVVEDSAVYRHLLKAQIEGWGYEVDAAPDAESALPLVEAAQEPMLLVIDWELPGMSGLDLVISIRRLCLKHYAYALVLTCRGEKDDLVTALNMGADDYLVKPFHDQELRARIQVAMRTLRLHQNLVLANERLEELASRDPLTDLLNRRSLMESFQSEMLRAVRKGAPVAVIMSDIDHFKEINDQHGHPVGDEVVKLVARVFRESSRGSDLVARVGGDEFFLVLPDAQAMGAIFLVQRVQQRLRERRELTHVPISLSFGITTMQHGHTPEIGMSLADEALYAAKRAGRDRYCFLPSGEEDGDASSLPPAEELSADSH